MGIPAMTDHRIDEIIDNHHGEASALIQVLLEIQRENHWLPKEALTRVSERLAVPLRRIQHIATFYKAFSLSPKGRHEVHVCMGTACMFEVRDASSRRSKARRASKPERLIWISNSASRRSTVSAAALWDR